MISSLIIDVLSYLFDFLSFWDLKRLRSCNHRLHSCVSRYGRFVETQQWLYRLFESVCPNIGNQYRFCAMLLEEEMESLSLLKRFIDKGNVDIRDRKAKICTRFYVLECAKFSYRPEHRRALATLARSKISMKDNRLSESFNGAFGSIESISESIVYWYCTFQGICEEDDLTLRCEKVKAILKLQHPLNYRIVIAPHYWTLDSASVRLLDDWFEKGGCDSPSKDWKHYERIPANQQLTNKNGRYEALKRQVEEYLDPDHHESWLRKPMSIVWQMTVMKMNPPDVRKILERIDLHLHFFENSLSTIFRLLNIVLIDLQESTSKNDDLSRRLYQVIEDTHYEFNDYYLLDHNHILALEYAVERDPVMVITLIEYTIIHIDFELLEKWAPRISSRHLLQGLKTALNSYISHSLCEKLVAERVREIYRSRSSQKVNPIVSIEEGWDGFLFT